jgi:hypothetical protein
LVNSGFGRSDNDTEVTSLLVVVFIIPFTGLAVPWGASHHQEILWLKAFLTVCFVIAYIAGSVCRAQAFSASIIVVKITHPKVWIIGAVNALLLTRHHDSDLFVCAQRVLLQIQFLSPSSPQQALLS